MVIRNNKTNPIRVCIVWPYEQIDKYLQLVKKYLPLRNGLFIKIVACIGDTDSRKHL